MDSFHRPACSRAPAFAAHAVGEGADVVLVAVGDAVSEVGLGLGEAPLADVHAAQVGVRAAGLLLQARRERDVERPGQQRRPLLVQRGGGAGLGVEGAAQRLPGGAARQRLRDGPGLPGQPDGGRLVAGHADQVGELGLRSGQPGIRAERFQDPDGGPGRGDGLRSPA
jgi:hypothetical protein